MNELIKVDYPLTFVGVIVSLLFLVLAFIIGTYIDKQRLAKKYEGTPKARIDRKEIDRLLEVEPYDENSYS